MNERRIILNAFRPNIEIESPSSFAGRKDEIAELTDALVKEGASPVIYGDRGLGKTSIALQIQRIALGDVELLQDFNLIDRALPINETFVVFYLACTDSMRNTNAVLQSLINQAEGTESLGEYRVVTESETTHKLKLKIYETEVKKKRTPFHRERSARLSTEDLLIALVEKVQANFRRPVLLIIDELDRVDDTSGLASFIKSYSSGTLKFLLVGVSQNVSELIEDHHSIERRIIPVNVKRMSTDELYEIITKVEKNLIDEGVKIRFHEEAKDDIVAAAAGFPWFVHVFAQESLLSAWEDKIELITKNYVRAAIAHLAANRFAQQFADLYTRAVGDSPQRETVLRLLAKWGDIDVPHSELYPLAKKAGVSNPSVCKKDLMLKKRGAILSPVPYKNARVVRFNNAMFMRYIDLRSSIYDGVSEEVNRLWRERHERLV